MNLKKNVLANMIISLIIGVLLGTVLVVLSSVLSFSDLLFWGLVIVGIITIISNVPELVHGIMNIKNPTGIVDLIFSAIGIVLGFMMIFMQGTIVTVIVAIYLIIFPIIRVIISRKGWKNQISDEWVKILIGVLLLAFLPALTNAANDVFGLILLIAGWVVIAISVILFAISLVAYISVLKKAPKDNTVEGTAEEKE
ncbi:MAG: hypothetical protein E7640_03700 [Ruminococcaceae bacterium]|nr:hypothetical protein [Oscillospiraceae bacterium]